MNDETENKQMIAPKHILGTFDEALTSLRNNVLMMAGLAERRLDRAIKGLLQRDDNLILRCFVQFCEHRLFGALLVDSQLGPALDFANLRPGIRGGNGSN